VVLKESYEKSESMNPDEINNSSIIKNSFNKKLSEIDDEDDSNFSSIYNSPMR